MLRKLFKGVVTGGIVGFVLGMLFAPAKGEESRAKLKEMAYKGKDYIGKAKADWEAKK